MLYFSPLSVTDDKQRDRRHPFSFPQCRQGNLGNRSMHLAAMQAWQCVCGGGGRGFCETLRNTSVYVVFKTITSSLLEVFKNYARLPQRGRSTTMQAVGFVRRSRIQVDILYSGTSPAGYNACAWTLAARESVCSVQSILGGGASLQYPCSRGPRGCETSWDVVHS